MHIYHIVLPKDWEIFKDRSFYEAPSLASEGFIHCSFEEQLDQVIGRYYSAARELVILTIDSGKLVSKLVSEPSTGNEHYPHVYGPINADAIIRVELRQNLPVPTASIDA